MLGLLAQTTFDSSSEVSGGAAAGIMIVWFLFIAVFALAQIIGMWKVFEKAGQKGWMALIPILNIYVLVRIAGKEVWWLILFLIPCVSFVAQIIVSMAVADKFGKSAGYGIGLAFFGVIFWPLLGFSDAQYQGDRTPVF